MLYEVITISKEFFLQNSKVFKAYYSYFAALKDGKEKKYNPTYRNGVRATRFPLTGAHLALDCAVCRSPAPEDQRTRCSALLSWRGHEILIDPSTDLRQVVDAPG